MTEGDGLFGPRLSSCRRSAGLSQEGLAKRAGLSVRTVSNLERGRARLPHPDSVRRLADALGLRGRTRREFFADAVVQLRPDKTTRAATVPDGRPGPAGGGLTSAARTAAAQAPRQLPAAVGCFAGRAAELAALSGLLQEQPGAAGPALVISAIGGMAGVGKTALAVQWAHQVAHLFTDGQLYVNLRGYDPEAPLAASDALAAFLRALGVPGQDIPAGTHERAALYRSLLAGRRVLVVLDNACDEEQVRPLLPGSAGCVAVVTSRDALAGLVARDGAVRLEVGLLELPEAVSLLRALIGSQVDDEPAAAIMLADQCGRLPLALRIVAERAAARPGVPLADLTAELADLRHRLAAMQAGADERTAVRAVLSWSCQRLEPGAAQAFRMAALHPGPDLDAYALAALAGTTPALAGQQLSELARAHLVQPAGPGRYGLHDLLRGYGTELVAAQDGAQARNAALTRLFDYYQDTARSAMEAGFPEQSQRWPAGQRPPGLTVPDFSAPPAALAWLDAELPALLAAIAYTDENGWPGHTTGLAAALYRYLDTGGHFAEAISIHTHARRAARRTGDAAAEADALAGLGLVHGHQGRHLQATKCFRQALARYRQVGDHAGQARALNYLGLIHCQHGRHPEATSDLQQAAALYQAAGDRVGQAYALSNLGVVAGREGRDELATSHQQQALALLGAARHRNGQAIVLERLSVLALRQGRFQEATSLLQRALTRYRSAADRQGQASALARLGVISLRQGRYHRAASQFDQALAGYREIGDPSGQAAGLNGLGEVLLATGYPADARSRHAAAIRLAAKAGDRYEQARGHSGIASAWQAAGDQRQARRHWQQALSHYTFLGAPEADQIRAGLAAAGPAAADPPLTTPAPVGTGQQG